MDDDAALDLAVVAQEDGTVELRIGRDLDAIFGPDAAAEIGAGQLDFDLTLQHIGVGAHVFGEVADIAPVALGDVAVDRVALLQHHGEEILAEVERFVALEIAEDNLGIQHVDAGVDGVAEDFTPAGLFQELGDVALVVGDDDAVFERIGDMGEGERRHRLALGVKVDNLGEVEIGEGVAADDEKRLVQQFFGILDAARGAQRHFFARVGDVHAELSAVAEIVLDGAGHDTAQSRRHR